MSSVGTTPLTADLQSSPTISAIGSIQKPSPPLVAAGGMVGASPMIPTTPIAPSSALVASSSDTPARSTTTTTAKKVTAKKKKENHETVELGDLKIEKWYSGNVPLGLDDDKYWLSELQVYLRANFGEFSPLFFQLKIQLTIWIIRNVR